MRKTVLLLLAVLLAAAGCGRREETGEGPGPRQRASASPPKPAICPLTAKPAASGLDVDRPALSVKIENAPESRPQSGLENADIVYEQLAEGGISRFNAIYHCSDAPQLGPVRSARSVDADILIEFLGSDRNGGGRAGVLFAYAGAAPPVEDKIAATDGIIAIKHGSQGSAFRRDRSRKAPHNVFSSTQQLRSVPDAKDVTGPPETGLQFEAPGTPPAPGAAGPAAGPGGASPAGASPAAGAGGNEISFSFGGRTPSRYTYDASSGTYLRFHGTQPHQAAGGSQLSATNVVVYKVQVRPGTIRDAAGNLSPEITVIGSGEAVILSGGKSVVGKWDRPSVTGKTTLTDAAGAPVKLKPGSTWIHLVPTPQAVTVK